MLNKDRLVYIFFLLIFVSLGAFLHWQMLNSPFIIFLYNYDYKLHSESTVFEILFSHHHRFIQIYRTIISNLVYGLFGITEITVRVFSVIAALLTTFFMYRFVLKNIGRKEALVSALLFFVSLHSLQLIHNPRYGSFYMFASFSTFYYLWKGVYEDKLYHWVTFGLLNFLNITNVICAGAFLPSLLAGGMALLWLYGKKDGADLTIARKKTQRFLVSFFASVGAALTLYYFRGLNLLGLAWDMVYLHNVDIKINPMTVETKLSFELLKQGFSALLKLNFYGQMAVSGGLPIAPWLYFILFVAGLYAYSIKHKNILWCFVAILSVFFITSTVVLKMVTARYYAFILPFYLVTVATGFVFLFSFLKKLIRVKTVESIVVLTSAFLLFSWLIYPKPLWSTSFLDEIYETKGMRAMKNHLAKNIKPSDIILNVTNATELLGDVGNAFTSHTFGVYLNSFFAKHRLELLPERKGRVGVWLILSKPLEDNGKLPFYFPRGYSPIIVKAVKAMVLYYGEIQLQETNDVEKDNIFTTPFWSFIKAWSLQSRVKYTEAEDYYLKAKEYGFNLELIYYNLGLVHITRNFSTAISFFKKAIDILETPTKIPDDAELKIYSQIYDDEGGLPSTDPARESPKLRFFMAKKNGVTYKTLPIEDNVKFSPHIYSEFYITLAKLMYSQYGRTGNFRLYEEAMSYFERGITIYPKHKFGEILKVLKQNKSRSFTTIIDPSSGINLLSVHDSYPSL